MHFHRVRPSSSMSEHEDPKPRHLLAALEAAGDLAYDWDVTSDSIAWRGSVGVALGIADGAAIASGRGFSGRINPEDLPLRQHQINGLGEGEGFDFEYRVRTDDGYFNWVHD